MIRLLIVLFIVLHGLVHLWYVTLSLRLVPFRPEMGWTGQSWLLPAGQGDAPLRLLAATLFAAVALAFVLSGIGLAANTGWWRPALAASAVASILVLVAFWDGSVRMPVEKGLVGLGIDVAIVVALVVAPTA